METRLAAKNENQETTAKKGLTRHELGTTMRICLAASERRSINTGSEKTTHIRAIKDNGNMPCGKTTKLKKQELI